MNKTTQVCAQCGENTLSVRSRLICIGCFTKNKKLSLNKNKLKIKELENTLYELEKKVESNDVKLELGKKIVNSFGTEYRLL